MYSTYYPLQELSNISDATNDRNTLGYLVIDSNQPTISIPLVTTLYDYTKFAEIQDVQFLELFPNDSAQISLQDLQAQVNTLSAQLTGSNTQIDSLNTIIDGLLAPTAELELWRTRKTFKRIIDNDLPRYPSGFPASNANIPNGVFPWDAYCSGLGKIFGPSLSPYEVELLEQFQTFLTNTQTLVNQGDLASIQIATLINDLLPPQLVINISGNTPPTNGYTANTSTIINKLRDPTQIATVLKSEINLLQTQDIPAIYTIITTGTTGNGTIYSFKDANNNPIYGNIANFRNLCKQYVYRAQDPDFVTNPADLGPLDCVLNITSKYTAELAVAILLNYSADKAATLGAAFYESIP